MTSSCAAGLFEYLLWIGDSDLILAQRLAAWCGKGPALEEDLALTNGALDLLGQARMWLSYAGELEAAGRDEDALAFLRDVPEFRNLLLVEQPNGDYAVTMGRQFFFDAWHGLLLDGLARSADRRIADIAGKATKEARYLLQRSSDWVVRLGDGTEESHRRMQHAIDELWPFTGEMFMPSAADRNLIDEGIIPAVAALRQPWDSIVNAVLEQASLHRPTEIWMQDGGRKGAHSEHLGYILAEMQWLPRAYPGARW